MKRKRKITDAEIIQFFFDQTLGRIFEKVQIYEKNPYMIIHDLKNLFYQSRYSFLNYVDPPPSPGKKETAINYYDRIHPRFGMRFYDLGIKMFADRDPQGMLEYYQSMKGLDKETRKALVDLSLSFIELNRKNEEMYQRYYLRNEMLKEEKD